MLDTPMKQWQGQWIWRAADGKAGKNSRHELVYFRKSFELPERKLKELILYATADSRYRFFINGHSVSTGPCKGHAHAHYYETVRLDAEKYLRPGMNVLAVAVLHYAGLQPFEIGEDGPLSVWRSETGGLLAEISLIDEHGVEASGIVSNATWKCCPIESYRLVADPLIRWMGGLEHLQGNDIPHGWLEPDYDDGAWALASVIEAGGDEYGQLGPWNLTERPIPPLYETERAFVSIVKSSSAMPQMVDAPIIVPAKSSVWLELDAGELTTGYIRLAIAGGVGSRIKLLCAECYEENTASEIRRKRVRNEPDTGVLIGGWDTYEPAGNGTVGKVEWYEPFWFRTFRYIRLEIEAGAEDVTVQGISYRETGYPLEVQASFACSDEQYNQLWALSLRTLKRCMHETYEDCPYYEQLQYAMDTELMMEFTYLLSGDDRLARRAIADFHASQLPDGMLQSRYPSVMPQIIPSFSLYWIHMISGHYRYYGDSELVKRYRPAMLSLLDWFGRRLTEQGLVGPPPTSYWNYFDWVPEWQLGAPQLQPEEPNILMSLMYAAALELAAELLEETGWSQAADELLCSKRAVIQAINDYGWSDVRQLYRDGTATEKYSQHTQIWAVLAGAADDKDGAALLKRMMTAADTELASVSLPMSYYLFRALQAEGQYAEAFALWDRWHALLELGLTTLPEMDTKDTRSDCHAWSSLPLSEFATGILGVSSRWLSGRLEIEVRPYFGVLEWAEGTVVTCQGPVHVKWTLEPNAGGGRTISIVVDAPVGVETVVALPGCELVTFNGGSFRMEAEEQTIS